MIRSILLLSLASCSLFSAEPQHNPCALAREVIYAGYAEACSGKEDSCCFCKCFLDGRRNYLQDRYRQDQSCECRDAVEELSCPCSRQQLEVATKCLDDRQACKARAGDFVGGEGGLCTLTPLP